MYLHFEVSKLCTVVSVSLSDIYLPHNQELWLPLLPLQFSLASAALRYQYHYKKNNTNYTNIVRENTQFLTDYAKNYTFERQKEGHSKQFIYVTEFNLTGLQKRLCINFKQSI